MAPGRLTALQESVLVVLCGLTPAWTLTGGGALVGFYTLHRETRDLDLFFRGERSLGTLVAEAKQRIEAAGLAVVVLRTTPTFSQLEARNDTEVVIVHLVADPTPVAEAPRTASIGGVDILVETPHQLLVNKLCALLGRSELRDLVDVGALLAAGEDLVRALHDCPQQDAGFSPLTLAWCLQGLEIGRLAAALGWAAPEVSAIERFRDELVARVLAEARPD